MANTALCIASYADCWRAVKTKGIEILCGKRCMILTSTVFDRSTRVPDRRTDRQTNGR